jgi:cytosine deaminase
MTSTIEILLDDVLLADGRRGALAISDSGHVINLIQHDGDRRSAIDSGCEVHDFEGRLLLPALAEAHAHLDKSLTAELAPNPTGDLRGAIEAWIEAERAGRFDHQSMVERVARSLEMLLTSGTTVVRSHINVGGAIGIKYLLAAQEAAARFRQAMDIEFVALTHMPMSGPGSEVNLTALDDAVHAGVDLVGGCPHLEPDPHACIDHALGLARRHGKAVDLHVDETLDPRVLTLSDLAERCRNVQVKVTASHCVSLGMLDRDQRRAVIDRVATAGVSVVALPQTNLFLQGRDHPVATPRGLTAVHDLVAAGVTVAAGADNAQDPFNLVGRCDPLETAALMVMAGHLLPDDAFAMVSANVRRLAGRGAAGTEPGQVADLIAINATSVRQVIAEAPADRIVLRGGRVVARTVAHTDLNID